MQVEDIYHSDYVEPEHEQYRDIQGNPLAAQPLVENPYFSNYPPTGNPDQTMQ